MRRVPEDYAKAFEERTRDVDILTGASRSIAAMHLGGMAVECRLKMLILLYHRVAVFGELGARPKDPLLGRPIVNPEHGLINALKGMRALWARAKMDKVFLDRLQAILYPLGSTEDHRHTTFVSIRYTGIEPHALQVEAWNEAWRYVIGWLHKNLPAIWGER